MQAGLAAPPAGPVSRGGSVLRHDLTVGVDLDRLGSVSVRDGDLVLDGIGLMLDLGLDGPAAGLLLRERDRLLERGAGVLHVGRLEALEKRLDGMVLALDHLSGIGVDMMLDELAIGAKHLDLILGDVVLDLEVDLDGAALPFALRRLDRLSEGDLGGLRGPVLARVAPRVGVTRRA